VPRAALIGRGAGGRRLAEALRAPGAPLRLAATCGSAEGALERLLVRDDLDAVLIAVPDAAHAVIAMAALDAGKHVYVLPPFTRTVDEARRLAARAREMDRVLCVAFDPLEEHRWTRAGQALAQTGAPRWIQAESSPDDPLFRKAWQRDPAFSQGPAARQLFNMLYPLQYHLGLGAPERATALGCAFLGSASATPDAALLTLHYADGATVVLSCADSSGRRGAVPVIRGALGSVDLPATHAPEDTLRDLARFAGAIAGDRRAADARLEAACIAQQALSGAMEAWARTGAVSREARGLT